MTVATNLKKFIGVLVKQVQAIEDAAEDILISRLVKYAYGAQLDVLGELAGQPRNSLGDATYRAAIILKIYSNNSSGNPEELAYIAKQISGATSVRYSEVGPGSYRLYFTGGTFPDGFLQQIQKLSPAGVRILGVHHNALRRFHMGDHMGQALLHE